METNWLDLAKQITEPLKCASCGRPIKLESSYPIRGRIVNGEVVEQEEVCWECAQQYVD